MVPPQINIYYAASQRKCLSSCFLPYKKSCIVYHISILQSLFADKSSLHFIFFIFRLLPLFPSPLHFLATGIGHGSLGERGSEPRELCVCRSDPNQGPTSGFSAKTRAQRTSPGMKRHPFYANICIHITQTKGKESNNEMPQASKVSQPLPAAMEHRFLSKSVLLHLTVVCVSLCLLMQLKSGEQVTHSSCHLSQPETPPSRYCDFTPCLVVKPSSAVSFSSYMLSFLCPQCKFTFSSDNKDQTRIRKAE